MQQHWIQSPGFFFLLNPAYPVYSRGNVSVHAMLLPSCNGQMVKEKRYSPLGILLIHTCPTVYTCAGALLPWSVAQKWSRHNLTGFSSKNLQHAALPMASWITLMILCHQKLAWIKQKGTFVAGSAFLLVKDLHKFISWLNDFWLVFMHFTWKQRIATSLHKYFTSLHIVAAIWLTGWMEVWLKMFTTSSNIYEASNTWKNPNSMTCCHLCVLWHIKSVLIIIFIAEKCMQGVDLDLLEILYSVILSIVAVWSAVPRQHHKSH